MTIVGKTLSEFLNGLHDSAYQPVFRSQQEYVDAYLDRVLAEVSSHPNRLQAPAEATRS